MLVIFNMYSKLTKSKSEVVYSRLQGSISIRFFLLYEPNFASSSTLGPG